MAYDYGSIDLGLRNPFKKEGLVTTLRGLLETLMGVFLLIKAASLVKTNAGVGWILVSFGLLLLGTGIRSCSAGIIAMLRYFVGRNHPTSLAHNYSRSESSTASEEARYVAYNRQQLTEMLMGRKNSTFVEPQGMLARLIHSLLPRLTLMPYPIRNLSQRLFGAWIKTLLALIAYGFAAFVSLAGFAGEIGEFVFPVYSVALTLYLLLVWRSVGTSIKRTADRNIKGMGSAELVRVIGGSILLPVVAALATGALLRMTNIDLESVKELTAFLPDPHTVLYLGGILIGALVCSVLVGVMLSRRLSYSDPKVEVSELRENWQESVHPNEIFINLDNLVMANRRYKEVPNRVYQELEPDLKEQVQGKGSFFGEMIQEIQPRVTAMKLGSLFERCRMVSLLIGNLMYIGAAALLMLVAFKAAGLFAFLRSVAPDSFAHAMRLTSSADFSDIASPAVHLLLASILVRAFARILTNVAHVFFAEMQFESHLIYVKMEGTFSESRMTTGKGIHDSTQSDNVLVRSSVTPWIIVSRIISSTYAATGMRNLEHPRYIMEMHKNDEELEAIRADVISFLKDRESIAAITSERDLRNASQIHEINQQSRAIPTETTQKLENDQAAGYLQQEAAEASEEVGKA
ncbi:hypothetical protein [Oceanobacter mangrovi]|uniref:hypothetical protein n=1 Tax=Oceanobacter mangrovi TaxID=2862510 RepID=UPI001C8DAB2C|nr:hypothetical protein [Oceanobacter mangrovi]